MGQWPNTWQVDEPDLPYGQGLLAELKPFVTHLIRVEQLSGSSIRRHLANLFLLGGELISHIDIFEQDRRLAPAKLLDQSISQDAGPLCRHVVDYQQVQYDATCRKLHAYRHSRKAKPRSTAASRLQPAFTSSLPPPARGRTRLHATSAPRTTAPDAPLANPPSQPARYPPPSPATHE